MHYPKINTLWKRYGLYTKDEDKKEIFEKFGKLPLETGNYSEPGFEFVDDWDVEEKINGTNIGIEMRERRREHIIKFHGKTKESEIPAHLLEYLKKEFTIEKLMHSLRNTNIRPWGTHALPSRIIFFGEACGDKIQGDYYNLKKPQFILFDVQHHHHWASRDTVRTIANQLNIKSAPSLGRMTENQIVEFVKSNPSSEINPEMQIEGIIARGEAWRTMEDGSKQFAGFKTLKLKCKDF
jgi:hypothetical protein